MKDNLKKEKLNIRITPKEKKMISRSAESMGMSLSDYARMVLLSSYSKAGKGNMAMTILLVEAQEIANYIDETYGEDKELERKVKKLWEIN